MWKYKGILFCPLSQERADDVMQEHSLSTRLSSHDGAKILLRESYCPCQCLPWRLPGKELSCIIHKQPGQAEGRNPQEDRLLRKHLVGNNYILKYWKLSIWFVFWLNGTGREQHSTREGYTDNKALKVKNVFLSLCTYHRLHNVLRGFIMRKMSITALRPCFGRN